MWLAGQQAMDPDLAPCGVAVFADDGRLLALNEPLIQLLMLDRESLSSRTIEDLLAPPARVFLQMVLMPMLRLKGRANEVSLILRTSQGTDIHVLASGIRHAQENGPINQCVFLPLEQRKKLEEQLMQSRRATEALPGVIFQLEIGPDGRGRFLHVSEGMKRLTGLSPDRLREDAELFFNIVHPSDRARMGAILQRDAAESTPRQYEFRLKPPGSVKPTWCEAHVSPRKLAGGKVLWNGYLADITHQRAVEESLRENDKLRLTAMLASGMAHDFNNLLGSINGLAELCLIAAEEGSRQQRNLRNILESGRKASVLVRQMLDYSRQTPKSLQTVSLGELVKRAEPLLRVGLPSGTELSIEVEAAAPVSVDPVQMEQVLLNLINNAGYAMRDKGGCIQVDIESAPAETSPLKCDGVRLRVIDQGGGIAPEHIKNIFQPFFTTKPVGDGTGLGLAAVHGIVKGHGGHIDVNSRLGAGSTFSVWLPLANHGGPITGLAVPLV